MTHVMVGDEAPPKIPPWKPTKWEKAVDAPFQLLAPRRYQQRQVARHQSYLFRYLSALPTTSRGNASPLTQGENQRGSREKMQVMWNALDLIENSGLCGNILTKITNYICGTLKYQARTGGRNLNRLIQQYIKSRSGKTIDLSERNTLRQLGIGLVKAVFLKGDCGCNIPRINGKVALQGIEGDRIGDPYSYIINNRFVRGVRIDDATGRVCGYDVYTRDRMSGMYRFDKTLPSRDGLGMPCFVFSANRVSLDDVRGITIFNSAINNASYINQMRQYELMAMLWASSRGGVFYTDSGMLPPGNAGSPYGNAVAVTPPGGQTYQAVQVRPNEMMSLGTGERAELFKSERPSPNVIKMYDNTINDIACGVKLSVGFVWGMSGLVNPAVRYASAQDSRQIRMWQDDIHDDLFEPIKNQILFDGVISGELPPDPRLFEGIFIFPPHPTIDAGRESDMDISEINAGITSGTRVCLENNEEQDIITDEIADETKYRIDAAKKVAEVCGIDDWREVYGMMRQIQGETRQSPQNEAALAAQQAGAAIKSRAAALDPERNGATDDGLELEY